MPGDHGVRRARRSCGPRPSPAIDIPKLCATDRLDAFGSCRVCLVEIDGRKGTPASCTTPVGAGHGGDDPDRQARAAPTGGDGALPLRPPLDCLTWPANGECELQDLAGAVGAARRALRRCGRDPPRAQADESNPYFTFDPTKCIVCSRCVRACDEIQGTIALTIQGRGFGSKVAASAGDKLLGLRVRVVRRVRAGVSDRHAHREVGRRARSAAIGACSRRARTAAWAAASGRSSRATRSCAWCPRRTAAPTRVTRASRVGSRGATRTTRTVCSPRSSGSTITDPWREATWDEAIAHTARAVRSTPGARSASTRSAASPRRAAPTKRCSRSRRWSEPRSGTTTSTPAPASATRRPASGSSRRSAPRPGTQDFRSVDQADVILLIGANPTDAHPGVRIADEASAPTGRAAHRRRPPADRPRALAARRGRRSSAAPPGDQRRARQRARPRRGHRGPGRPASSSPSACEPEEYAQWARVHLLTGEQPRGHGAAHRRARGGRACRRSALRDRAATPRSTTGSASPSTARARRWSWGWPTSPWRPATSVATALASTRSAGRTTCRARATWARSRTSCRATATCRMHRCATCSSPPGVSPSIPSPGCGSPTCSSAAIGGEFTGLFVQGEDIAQSDPEHDHVTGRPRRDGVRGRAGPVPQRDREYAHVFLPGTSFLEKDGTFTNAERRINRVRPVMAPGAGSRSGRWSAAIADGDGSPDAVARRGARSWTRSPRSRRRSPGCRSRSSTRSAACSGRATTRHR